ncbi:uncharacterized protein NEMAJ01_2404 [Nematocida major]|uniref:uncharacterized protein n=1 Tax=Nematocida major TaxID=1912982 RepID=UPI0020086BF5|nr:uncharacterized protein NEMAJ01_2404 [Nematocida major]KAH9387508.1 hypothetical protein NEMAJ01_2404 [Nematocida major]
MSILKEEGADVMDKMFFAENGDVISDFTAWIPGLSILQRRSYHEKTDEKLLLEVKADLRKKGFIV